MKEPLVLAIVLSGMLFFGLAGFFGFIYPFILYRKTPDVQAESDGEFLYIHTKKEAKIPLSSLADATVYTELPFLFQKEFVKYFIIHIFSDAYGDVILEVPEYGKFKMSFVSRVEESANRLLGFISDNISD
jgi:hypothetical protein